MALLSADYWHDGNMKCVVLARRPGYNDRCHRTGATSGLRCRHWHYPRPCRPWPGPAPLLISTWQSILLPTIQHHSDLETISMLVLPVKLWCLSGGKCSSGPGAITCHHVTRYMLATERNYFEIYGAEIIWSAFKWPPVGRLPSHRKLAVGH